MTIKNKSFKKGLGLGFAALILGTQFIAPMTMKAEAATATKTTAEAKKTPFRGMEETTIKVNDSFNALTGVKAIDYSTGKDLTSQMTVVGTVDVTTAGTYELAYFVKDSTGEKVMGERNVKVVTDREPVIQGAESLVIKEGSKFVALAGIMAVDEEDGDISKDVQGYDTVNTNKIGTYHITYYVTDSAGNVGIKERTISVVSKDAPIIKGADYTEIQVDSRFNPLDGVSATAVNESNLTDHVKVTGNVDTKQSGTYELTYSVTDAQNHTSSITRTVKVLSNKKIVISGTEDKTLDVKEHFDPLEGVKAINAEGKDVMNLVKYTSNVVEGTIGNYTVKYSIIDSVGNVTTAERKVDLISGNVPVIHGAENLNVKLNGTFDPFYGVTATDVEDGDLTAAVQGVNIVNTKKAGRYEMTYYVIDSAGNVGVKIRVITVA